MRLVYRQIRDAFRTSWEAVLSAAASAESDTALRTLDTSIRFANHLRTKRGQMPPCINKAGCQVQRTASSESETHSLARLPTTTRCYHGNSYALEVEPIDNARILG
jgi:hypothetical protein